MDGHQYLSYCMGSSVSWGGGQPSGTTARVKGRCQQLRTAVAAAWAEHLRACRQAVERRAYFPGKGRNRFTLRLFRCRRSTTARGLDEHAGRFGWAIANGRARSPESPESPERPEQSVRARGINSVTAFFPCLDTAALPWRAITCRETKDEVTDEAGVTHAPDACGRRRLSSGGSAKERSSRLVSLAAASSGAATATWSVFATLWLSRRRGLELTQSGTI